MFIHLGGNQMISVKEVIAIIDATTKKDAFANMSGWIEKIEGGETKSYVVTDYKIYASPISSLTLKKRAKIERIIPVPVDKQGRNHRK